MVQLAGKGGVLLVPRSTGRSYIEMNLTNTLCQSRFPQEYITSMTWHPPMKCAPVIFTSLPALYSECTNPQLHKATQFPMFSTRWNTCKALCQTRTFTEFFFCKKQNNLISHSSLEIFILIWNEKYFEHISIPAWLCCQLGGKWYYRCFYS